MDRFIFLLVVAFSVVFGQNPKGASVDPKTGLSEPIKKKMLELHNDARRRQGASDMNELEWSEEIAIHSKQWADQCQFHHNYSEQAKNSTLWPQGQNLYATTGESNLYAAVPIWAAEQHYYDYDKLSCEPGKPCGHYTLMVWSSIEKVGCAYTKCPVLSRGEKKDYTDAHYIVCQYYPQGNFVGMKPFTKGKACSECNNNLAFCKNGLCQPKCPGKGCVCNTGIECPYCQQRDSTTCACKCQKGFLGKKCDEICYDWNPDCKKYLPHKNNERVHKMICDIPFAKKSCPKFCNRCQVQEENSNWNCKGRNYKNFLAKFTIGEKVGKCTYPFKYMGKYYTKGECFDKGGKKYCSESFDYDTYKTKAKCPFE